jgi:hypothetical protein
MNRGRTLALAAWVGIGFGCGDDLGPREVPGDPPHSLRFEPRDGALPSGGYGVIVPITGQLASLGAGDFTIEMWVKSRKDTLVAWGGCRAGYQEGLRWLQGHGLVDRTARSSSSFFGLGVYGDAVSFGIGDETQFEGGVCEPAYLNDEQWHHVAAVREGSSIRVFVDGISTQVLRDLTAGDVSYKGPPSGPGDLDAALVLGGWKQSNQVPPWSGWIDEIRLSTVARYPHEPAPTAPFEPDEDTALLYHFDRIIPGGKVIDAVDETAAGGQIVDDPASGYSIRYDHEQPF